MKDYKSNIDVVLNELGASLGAVDTESVERLMDLVLNARSVFFVGVGRVLLSLQAIAKRWAHIGLETHIVGEITEPAITPRDILIVASGSGESLVPVAIAKRAKELGAKVVYIGSNVQSTVASMAEVMVRIPVCTKLGLADEISSVQPMTSLFEQTLLLYGDSLAAIMIDRQGIVLKDLWHQHANLE